jgi:hypothetical protein
MKACCRTLLDNAPIEAQYLEARKVNLPTRRLLGLRLKYAAAIRVEER